MRPQLRPQSLNREHFHPAPSTRRNAREPHAYLKKILLPTHAAVLGWLLAGCATTPVAEAPRTPVSETPRAVVPDQPGRFFVRVESVVGTELGAVALVRHPIRADLQLERLPLSHGEAGRAGVRRVFGEKPLMGDPGPAIILVPAALALGAAGGWIYGSFSGMNAEELNRATAALARAGADFAIVDRLTASILARAAEYPARSVTLHLWQLPGEPPAVQARLRAIASGGAGRSAGPLPPHPLADQAIDTVAVLEVRYHALCGSEQKDSPLTLQLQVKVRLQRTSDWSDAGEFFVYYTSAPQSLAEWAQNAAQLLRRDWEIGLKGLEQRIPNLLARHPPDSL